MRKISMMIVAALCAVYFVGCAEITVANKGEYKNEKISFAGEPCAHLNANNWGLYLFMIPILTGSTEDVGKTVFFTDSVTVSEVLKITSAKAKTVGATSLCDVVSRHNASGFMFYFRQVEISANAVK